ncbi:hypothetical protein CVT26_009408 [Gymnopilus dilepis]|uniref:Uncharacterized protein n=1 Tax=Gymnopilus dilepis TaxID=231916 RepID=A0A409VK71_9AGAR|nr:hypothetical protein CVT26_009408 [Gymnopilus dilepis]
MAVFVDHTGYPPLMTPQGKRLAAFAAIGSAAIIWAFWNPVNSRPRAKDTAPHGHPKDALRTVSHPAKNADVKGSLPSAHGRY